MNKLVFIVLPLFGNTLLAQREAYSWIYGNCDTTNNCEGVYGTSVIRFNDDSIESIRRVDFPVPLGFLSSACVSRGNKKKREE